MHPRCSLIIVALFASAMSVSAQDEPPPADANAPISGFLFGASVGVPGVGSNFFGELFTVGLHWTDAKPGRFGLDFSLGTIPRALAEGVGTVGVRGGLALPIAFGNRILFIPSGGGSAIAAAGGGDGGGAWGYSAGTALVFLKRNRGLRTGVTWHWFFEESEPLWLFELGFVALRRP